MQEPVTLTPSQQSTLDACMLAAYRHHAALTQLDSSWTLPADTIGDKMEGLRKGKADVLEAEHTLLLGWSDKLLAIVDQICNANASEGGRPIVILAEKDKVDMEEAIDKHSPNLRGSRVICRCGLWGACVLELRGSTTVDPAGSAWLCTGAGRRCNCWSGQARMHDSWDILL